MLLDVRERERGDARELGFTQVEGDFDSFVGRWVVTPRCISGHLAPLGLPQAEHFQAEGPWRGPTLCLDDRRDLVCDGGLLARASAKDG